MRRASVILAVLAAAPGAAAFADEPAPPRNGLQLDLGLAVIGAAYERVIVPRLAVQVEAQLFRTWFLEPDLQGIGGQIRPTLFLGARPPRGVYVATYGRLDQVTTTIEGVDGDGYAWSVGQFVGYTFIVARHFQFRIGGGVQVLRYHIDLDGGGDDEDTRVLPALDALVGWHF